MKIKVLIIFLLLSPIKASLENKKIYERIISTAPSITQIFESIQAMGHLAGVSRFCAVKDKPTIGGYLDINLEKIISLKPDLILLLGDFQNAFRVNLERLSIKSLTINHQNIKGILDSIILVGKLTGKEQQASRLVKELEMRMKQIAEKRAYKICKKVLIVVDDSLNSVYVAGRDSFYNELLQKIAACNAAPVNKVVYPRLSVENLMNINPDVIIDINLHHSFPWSKLKKLKAVKTRKVYKLNDKKLSVPGPNFISILEKFDKLINNGNT